MLFDDNYSQSKQRGTIHAEFRPVHPLDRDRSYFHWVINSNGPRPGRPAANVPEGYAAMVKKPKPADIRGCWTGAMEDSISGAGTISFKIKQSGAQIVKDTGHNSGSRIDVEYPYPHNGSFKAPVSGTITNGTSITFNTVVNKNCSGKGTATVVNSNDIEGELDFNCGPGFGHVTYPQLTHTTCKIDPTGRFGSPDRRNDAPL